MTEARHHHWFINGFSVFKPESQTPLFVTEIFIGFKPLWQEILAIMLKVTTIHNFRMIFNSRLSPNYALTYVIPAAEKCRYMSYYPGENGSNETYPERNLNRFLKLISTCHEWKLLTNEIFLVWLLKCLQHGVLVNDLTHRYIL
jgi:hypothetical protein